MTNTAEYFNTLIGEFVNVEKTGATLQSVQLIFAMIVAILTTILKGDPKTVYKNNPEILKRRRIEFDFIVVGSGAGGSVVAARLSELRDRTTLILEGGCDDPGLYSEVDKLCLINIHMNFYRKNFLFRPKGSPIVPSPIEIKTRLELQQQR